MADRANEKVPEQQAPPKNKGPKGNKNKKRGGPPSGDKPMEGTEITPIRVPANISRELDQPTLRKENKERQPNIKTREDSIFAESIFTKERTLKPVTRVDEFTPSAVGYMPCVEEMYSLYKDDKSRQVAREFPIEAFRYYASVLFWLRAIGLKLGQNRPLTFPEEQVSYLFARRLLTVPEPLHLAMKSIGDVTTMCGDVLSGTLPDLPATVTLGIPGTLGVVSPENHNVYEECPVIGVAFQGMVERTRLVGQAHPWDPREYQSVVAPQGTVANVNLQGFNRLARVRPEPVTFLEDLGFVNGAFPETIRNTGIDYGIVERISRYVSLLGVFKNYAVDVTAIPKTGSIGQIIQARPVVSDIDDRSTNARQFVTMRSAEKDDAVPAAVSEVFGLNQYKENRTDTQVASEQIANWCCISYSELHPPEPDLINNRNGRRNVPPKYDYRSYESAADETQAFRQLVIGNMAKGLDTK